MIAQNEINVQGKLANETVNDTVTMELAQLFHTR